MLRERGAWFHFTPRYSADLNPIGSEAERTPQAEGQMAFAKLKAQLRRIDAITIEAMCKEITNICDRYTPQECQNLLKATSYVFE